MKNTGVTGKRQKLWRVNVKMGEKRRAVSAVDTRFTMLDLI